MKLGVGGISVLLFLISYEAQATIGGGAQSASALSRTDLVQWTTGLGLVLFLILILAFFLRRFNQFSFAHGKRLRILGGISLGTRERVVLLQVGEKQLLLGVAPGRVETLYVLDADELETAENDRSNHPERPVFADRIKQAMRDS